MDASRSTGERETRGDRRVRRGQEGPSGGLFRDCAARGRTVSAGPVARAGGGPSERDRPRFRGQGGRRGPPASPDLTDPAMEHPAWFSRRWDSGRPRAVRVDEETSRCLTRHPGPRSACWARLRCSGWPWTSGSAALRSSAVSNCSSPKCTDQLLPVESVPPLGYTLDVVAVVVGLLPALFLRSRVLRSPGVAGSAGLMLVFTTCLIITAAIRGPRLAGGRGGMSTSSVGYALGRSGVRLVVFGRLAWSLRGTIRARAEVPVMCP
jgi:hypothetical protein